MDHVHLNSLTILIIRAYTETHLPWSLMTLCLPPPPLTLPVRFVGVLVCLYMYLCVCVCGGGGGGGNADHIRQAREAA